MGSIKEINKKVLSLEGSALKNKKITKTHSDYIVAVLAGKKGRMERAYDYKSKVFFDDLGDLEKAGKNVATDAIKKLNSRKIKTCKCDVIYDSKISSSLLSNLFNACNASSIIKGTSFLKKKKGKKKKK